MVAAECTFEIDVRGSLKPDGHMATIMPHGVLGPGFSSYARSLLSGSRQ
jgi:hypothetical protein